MNKTIVSTSFLVLILLIITGSVFQSNKITGLRDEVATIREEQVKQKQHVFDALKLLSRPSWYIYGRYVTSEPNGTGQQIEVRWLEAFELVSGHPEHVAIRKRSDALADFLQRNHGKRIVFRPASGPNTHASWLCGGLVMWTITEG